MIFWLACIPEPVISMPTPRPLSAPAAWRRLNPALSGATLFDIDGAGSVGFAVGNRGTVLRTLDGGATWDALSPPTDALLFAVSVTEDTVWIGGHGALLQSMDRGETWLDVGTPHTLVALSGDADGVVAVTEDGALLTPDEVRHDEHRILDVQAADGGRLLLTREALLWMAADGTITTAWGAPEGAQLIDLNVSGADIDLLAKIRTDHADTLWIHLRLPENPAARWWPETRGELDTRLIQTHTLARGPDWLAIGGDGHDSWRSTDDGQTWQRSWDKGDLSSNYALHTRAMWAAPTGLYAAADTTLLRSTDGGHAWEAVDGRPVDFLWGGDLAGATLWMAAPHTVVRHQDGEWSRLGPVRESLSGAMVPMGILGGGLDAVVSHEGAVVVAGSRGMWRGNGTDWRHAADPVGHFRGLARVEGALVAVGTRSMRSTDDGRSWSTTSDPWPHEIWGIGQDGTHLWGVGESGLTIFSPDSGQTWQIIEDEFTGHLSDVAVSEGAAIAVGSEGTILRREDGPWQAAESGTDAELRAIWHDQKTGTWAAVGDRGTALLSHDGLTWTAEQTGTGQSLWGIFGDHSGRIIAVGTGGIVLERTPQ